MVDALAVFLCLACIVASAWTGARTVTGKLLAVAAVVGGTTLLVGVLLRLTPGDPVTNILGEQAPDASRHALAVELALENADGTPRDTVSQLGGFVRGTASAAVLLALPTSLGTRVQPWLAAEPRSYRTRESVRVIIARRLPATAALALASLCVSVLLGVGLGVLCTRRGVVGALANGAVLVSASMPRIFLGPVLLVLFAVRLRVLPVSGDPPSAAALLLPALTLGTLLASMVARLLRTTLVELEHSDSVRTAHAKGASQLRVVSMHLLRQALLPVIALLGLQLGGLFAGAVVTEKLFGWPGIGTLLVDSVRKLDLPVVQGIVVVMATAAAVATLLSEAATQLLDPRLRRRG